MNKILIGTGNKSKLALYKKNFEAMGLNLDLVSSKDLDIAEPEENAKDFEAEAINKARYYFQKSGIPTIADDGGFEIEALNGEPGMKSNRWIGREMTDEEIIAEVFKRMAGKENRKAKHIIVMALATPFGVFTSRGEIEGIILEKPSEKRHDKFPYRSVLYLPNYHKFWIDLTDEEEQIMNHRAHAMEKLKDILKELNK